MSSNIIDRLENVKAILDFIGSASDVMPSVAEDIKDTIEAFKDKEEEKVATVVEPDVMPDPDYKTKAELGVSNTGKNYFSDSELADKSNGELVFDNTFRHLLNEARERAGNPWIVTSGYRTPEHNAAVCGVENSSHTKGVAVDIKALDGAKKFEVISNAIYAGIERIGVADTFIHLDNDQDKPKPTIWLY